ncbi:MAG: peptidyl-prolyl cis-trans isomerase [Gammaproteobacteria bacterium]|nr:peptidyl-prolyl cis-trans isomerase [Gammaproteobacteria bacterium]
MKITTHGALIASILSLNLGANDMTHADTTVNMETSKGPITLELYEGKAPVTVENFVAYARDGFYDGTVFHRVIPGFMIQGGGFTPKMSEKDTRDPVKNEADNGLQNTQGSIAMARTPDPDSASSQFFINLQNNDFLNFKSKTPQGWGYAVFGKVTQGLDVVEAIAKVATGNQGPHQNVPREPVIIEKVSVVD